jgi:hypothetical protein
MRDNDSTEENGAENGHAEGVAPMSGADEPLYVVWSNEQSAWWGAGGRGYTTRISEAGRYTREGALWIATRAIPGHMAMSEGILPEIPVLLEDVLAMQARHRDEYPGLAPGPWE